MGALWAIFFEEAACIAEGRLRFALRFFERCGELRFVANDAHAAAAPAHRGFYDDGIADFFSDALGFFRRLDGVFCARQSGDTRRGGEFARSGLVAEQLEQVRSWPDKCDARLFAGACEVWIFGQESISRVNRVNVVLFRDRDDARNVEIRFDRAFADADLIGLVGLEAMEGEAILLRINRYGAQAEFGGGAEDTNRDLAAIGGEQFLDRFGLRHPGSLLTAAV